MCSPELEGLVTQTLVTAEHTGQRPVLWLAGNRSETLNAAKQLIILVEKQRLTGSGVQHRVWVSCALGDRKRFDERLLALLQKHSWSVPVHRTHLLGTQSDLLIFDAHEGFNPDLFCLATGTLRGGGLLVLLAPDDKSWVSQPDKDYQRMLVYPRHLSEIRGRFIQRVCWSFQNSGICTVWPLAHNAQRKPLVPDLPVSPHALRSEGPVSYTKDQLRVIDTLTRSAGERQPGERTPPLVITADRGRGKSSALGAGIAALQGNQKIRNLWITAPNKDNVRVLFSHCGAQLGLDGEQVQKLNLECNGLKVSYLAPDEALIRLREKADCCDLLVVDEAAGISESMLREYAELVPWVVYATTVHGYEGTGRGFKIRFQRYLEESFPGAQSITLEQPIRWGNHDLLEQLLNQTFLLGAETEQAEPGPELHDLQVREVSQDELLHNPDLLARVFTLLMHAHYRTSPGDLRDLLDGLNLRLFVLGRHQQVLGCCLVALEGPLPAELVEAVFRGRRRPRGHLLPQTLCQCLGFTNAAMKAGARVVRIAVEPALQKQGLGTKLLAGAEQRLREEGIDYIGSSFAAYPDVIAFWERNDYLPVRMGFSREPASGAHSLLIMKTLATGGTFDNQVNAMSEKFFKSFRYLCRNELRSLDPAVIISLLPGNGAASGTDECKEYDAQQVRMFVEGGRTFEDARYDLWLFWMALHRKLQQGIPPAKAAGGLSDLTESRLRLLTCLFNGDLCLEDLKKKQLINGKKDGVQQVRAGFASLQPLTFKA